MQKRNYVLMAIAGVLLLLIAGSTMYMALGMHRVSRQFGSQNRDRDNYGMHDRGDGFRNQVQLNDAQKKEIAPLVAQLNDVHQQIAQKLVASGVITQADADNRIAVMKERSEKNLAEGRLWGMGPGGPGDGFRNDKDKRHKGDYCSQVAPPPPPPGNPAAQTPAPVAPAPQAQTVAPNAQ